MGRSARGFYIYIYISSLSLFPSLSFALCARSRNEERRKLSPCTRAVTSSAVKSAPVSFVPASATPLGSARLDSAAAPRRFYSTCTRYAISPRHDIISIVSLHSLRAVGPLIAPRARFTATVKTWPGPLERNRARYELSSLSRGGGGGEGSLAPALTGARGRGVDSVRTLFPLRSTRRARASSRRDAR